MKIEGTHEIPAAREVVYRAMTDPKILQRCIPGCQSMEKTDENTYEATMKAGVGSIKGTFKGNVRLEELREPIHYRMLVDGKGAPGFVKGAGEFNLVERNGGTAIAYEGEMKVGGVIAGVGQRMIEAAARMLAAQFFKSLAGEIAGGDAEPLPH